MIEGPGRWDLTQLFADGDAAIVAASELASGAAEFARNASRLLGDGALDAFAERFGTLDLGLDEVVDYARMRQYEDAEGEGVQALVARVQEAVTRGRASLERALDAWRALDEDTAVVALGDLVDPAASYRLRRARTLARSRLAPEVEAAWEARTGSARDRWAALQELLEARARVSFDDGTGLRDWGVGDLGTLLRHPSAELRRAAHRALGGAFVELRDVLALAWDAAVVDRLVEDRLRGRTHPAQQTLEEEDLPLRAFESLLAAVPRAHGARQRLLERQAADLGLDDFCVADADAPVEGLPTLDFAEVAELALAGLGSLHPQLEADGRALVERRRLDAETRPGKQQYAVTFATRLDPPAFLSFRYTGQAANVPLLGHELGHAVAIARTAAAQPPVARGWPGVAFEIPSMTGEIAAGDAFAAAYPVHEPAIRFVLAQDLAWSVFESIAFCLVELDLYEARAAGTVLTGDVIQEAFGRRFGDLYGPGVPFDDTDAVVAFGSWANYAVPSRFYNFQYAVGALAALALQDARRTDPEAFGSRYLAFLAAGRSASPADQLAGLGLELGPETWAAGLAELDRRFALAGPVTPR